MEINYELAVDDILSHLKEERDMAYDLDDTKAYLIYKKTILHIEEMLEERT